MPSPDGPSTRRDSFFGERVLWSGRPKVLAAPRVNRIAAGVCAVAAAIAVASAIVVATTLQVAPGPLLGFGAWMATFAVALGLGPRWWRSELEFVLTDRSVVVRRGRLRRTIERRAISFARIHWHAGHPGIGDLELVRAVPTGALRRGLSIVLPGLVAPDRVWAIIRGVTPHEAMGMGHRLLAQRLDEGERVVWSGHPARGHLSYVPAGWRTVASLALGVVFAAVAASTTLHGSRGLGLVLGAGLQAESVSFVALAASVGLTVLLLVAAAIAVVYVSVVRPARLAARARYLVTDRRVLIQRGDEELHLDRSRIVDVIQAPSRQGASDLFLVLDGPRSRALAPSGAFGEASPLGLQPVLQGVTDAEAVVSILRPSPPARLLSAA